MKIVPSVMLVVLVVVLTGRVGCALSQVLEEVLSDTGPEIIRKFHGGMPGHYAGSWGEGGSQQGMASARPVLVVGR
jgi:hypothetical protein